MPAHELKEWPATAARLVCVPIPLFREKLRTKGPIRGAIPVPRKCRDCGRDCVTSVMGLLEALGRPGRNGRPLRPICTDCREHYLT